jgi:hypothetical protein
MGERQHSLTPGTRRNPSWATVVATTLRLWLQRHTHRGRGGRSASRRQRGVLILSAAAAMAVGALVTLAFTGQGETAQNASSVQSADPAQSTPSALQTAQANRGQAAGWIAQQMLPSVLIGCDPLMCQALEAAGVEVLVATPALRSQFGPRLATVYAPLILASFGAGAQRIDIRYLAPGGTAPFQASLASARNARIEAGRQLLSNKNVRASAQASGALLAGNVDPRLLVTLSLLAHEMQVQLIIFNDPSPGASSDVPLRGAEIGAPGASGLSAVLAFLAQQTTYQPSHYQQVRTASGQVVTMQYDAPGPLGLNGP